LAVGPRGLTLGALGLALGPDLGAPLFAALVLGRDRRRHRRRQ
jgi:hypothetical protein